MIRSLNRTLICRAVLSVLAIYATPATAACVDGYAWHIEAEGLPGSAIDTQVYCDGNDYILSVADLRELGLLDTSKVASKNGMIKLEAVGQLEVDELNSKMKLIVNTDLRPLRVINLSGLTMAMDPLPRIGGGYLNYDIRASAGGLSKTGISALFDANTFVAGDVALNLQGFMSNQGDRKFERISASASGLNISKMTSWSIGDAYSSGGDGVNPVRFTGLQFKKDYSIQPGFITQPTYDFAVSAASKSTIDVLLDNRKIHSESIDAGPISITNMLPFIGPTGAQIVIRDAFGQEQIISSQLIGNPTLLRAGLDNYAFQVGKMRPTSFRTEGIFASGFYRRGLSDYITAEVNAEKSTQGKTLAPVQHLGVSISTATPLGDFGFSAREGSGRLLSGTYQNAYRGNGWTASIASNVTRLQNYEVMGAAINGGTDQQSNGKVTATTNALNLSLHIDGGYFASAFRAKNQDSIITGLSLSYSQPKMFSPTYSVSAQVRSGNGRSESSIFFGVNIPLDGIFSRGIALAGRDTSSDRTQSAAIGFRQVNTGLQRVAEYTNHAVSSQGFNLKARESNFSNSSTLNLDANFAGLKGDVGIAASTTKNAAYTAYARGSVGLADGHVGLMRSVTGGFAFIDAGAPKVSILLNNQPAGESGADGTLFVSGLIPHIKSKISIDPDSAPANYDADFVDVSSFPRSGVKVSFKGSSAAMLEIDGFTSGVISVDGYSQSYPITERGAYLELPAGEYSGIVNEKIKVNFTIPAAIAGESVQKIKANHENS